MRVRRYAKVCEGVQERECVEFYTTKTCARKPLTSLVRARCTMAAVIAWDTPDRDVRVLNRYCGPSKSNGYCDPCVFSNQTASAGLYLGGSKGGNFIRDDKTHHLRPSSLVCLQGGETRYRLDHRIVDALIKQQ
jgi:hypothetical protein